jgi:hypothetical protein
MKKYLAIFVFLGILIGCTTGPKFPQKPLEITIDEYSEHLMHYFENKNDTIIYETISIYENDDNVQILGTIDSIIVFFFYGIKTENISRYNNFFKIVKENNIERLINIFQLIEDTDIAASLEQQEAGPELNDMYWALYFSTGDIKYINKLLNVVMNHYNETNDANYYMAARSAMWSLASNMITYFQIKEYILGNDILSNEIKEYIINTDPNIIQNDTIEFINEQRQKGIW